MAVSDNIIKGVGVLITTASLAFGIGSILGRNSEVATVRTDVAAVKATQGELGKAQEVLRTDVKESIREVKDTVNKAADDAEKTRKIVERMERGAVIGAKGKQQ